MHSTFPQHYLGFQLPLKKLFVSIQAQRNNGSISSQPPNTSEKEKKNLKKNSQHIVFFIHSEMHSGKSKAISETVQSMSPPSSSPPTSAWPRTQLRYYPAWDRFQTPLLSVWHHRACGPCKVPWPFSCQHTTLVLWSGTPPTHVGLLPARAGKDYFIWH